MITHNSTIICNLNIYRVQTHFKYLKKKIQIQQNPIWNKRLYLKASTTSTRILQIADAIFLLTNPTFRHFNQRLLLPLLLVISTWPIATNLNSLIIITMIMIMMIARWACNFWAWARSRRAPNLLTGTNQTVHVQHQVITHSLSLKTLNFFFCFSKSPRNLIRKYEAYGEQGIDFFGFCFGLRVFWENVFLGEIVFIGVGLGLICRKWGVGVVFIWRDECLRFHRSSTGGFAKVKIAITCFQRLWGHLCLFTIIPLPRKH